MRIVCSRFLGVLILYYFFFFFQAEDGIRDIGVTGVQTCALPICRAAVHRYWRGHVRAGLYAAGREAGRTEWQRLGRLERSEERRVGKECRSRWGAEH